MKNIKKYLLIILPTMMLMACGSENIAEPAIPEATYDSSVVTQEEPSMMADTVASETDASYSSEEESSDKIIVPADTLPKPHKIIKRNNPNPSATKDREMPRPGVSEQDKREIDSIKTARSKTKNH